MLSFEQAVDMALAFDSRMNKFAEYENSFELWWDCGVEMIGPQPYIALKYSIPEGEEFAFLADVASWPREEARSSGFVFDTLGAAIWCFANTDSYADCVLAAVNLGSDTDTTACVAGALAGAVYGYNAIPAEWLETLRGKDVIEQCLFSGFEKVRSWPK